MVDKKQLFQVDVDLDLSKQPAIRDMFTNGDIGRDLVVFLRANNIQLHSKEGIPTVTHISLRGSPEGLHKFVQTYFTADETPVVYNCTYR